LPKPLTTTYNQNFFCFIFDFFVVGFEVWFGDFVVGVFGVVFVDGWFVV